MTGRIASLVAIVALVMSSWWVAAGQASRGAARTQTGATAQVTVLGQGAKTLTGTGRKSLGQIRLERTTTLSWLHPRGRLQITTGTKRPFLLLSTTRKQGSIALRRGTYNAVRVATRGAWRIQLGTAK